MRIVGVFAAAAERGAQSRSRAALAGSNGLRGRERLSSGSAELFDTLKWVCKGVQRRAFMHRPLSAGLFAMAQGFNSKNHRYGFSCSISR